VPGVDVGRLLVSVPKGPCPVAQWINDPDNLVPNFEASFSSKITINKERTLLQEILTYVDMVDGEHMFMETLDNRDHMLSYEEPLSNRHREDMFNDALLLCNPLVGNVNGLTALQMFEETLQHDVLRGRRGLAGLKPHHLWLLAQVRKHHDEMLMYINPTALLRQTPSVIYTSQEQLQATRSYTKRVEKRPLHRSLFQILPDDVADAIIRHLHK
jgi:hypothetical protein